VREEINIPTLSRQKTRDKGGAPGLVTGPEIMDIEDWRKKIDDLDRKLVALLSERAKAAIAIGKLKRDTSMPIYEPDRERVVFENVQGANSGPLPGRDLVRIYERIIDVMRNIQKEQIVSTPEASEAETELDSEVND
jgi:chorismate mutase